MSASCVTVGTGYVLNGTVTEQAATVYAVGGSCYFELGQDSDKPAMMNE